MQFRTIFYFFTIWTVCLLKSSEPSSVDQHIDNAIFGTYELVSDPKGPDYIAWLKAMAYDLIFVDIAKRSKTKLQMTKFDDGTFGFRHGTNLTFVNTKFQNGVPFTGKLHDLRRCNYTITLSGHKADFVQQAGAALSTISDEFTSDGVTSTMVCKNVTAVLQYKRIV